ncbi:MAG: hypothetical protein NVV62_16710 [Terricaulis sp.]|nr:hypothetical protein [Terricaulis sp.]
MHDSEKQKKKKKSEKASGETRTWKANKRVAGRRGRRLQGQGAEAQGNEPGLTRERIASTAVGMLDANGLYGLTMRGLAEALK